MKKRAMSHVMLIFAFLFCQALYSRNPNDQKSFFPDTSSNRVWRLIGPGISGCMGEVVFHPRDPKTIYGGTDMGAVFKTIDGGLSWQMLGGASPSNRGVATAMAFRRSIAVAWNNPEIVWFANNRVYKSTDGGKTIQPVEESLITKQWRGKQVYIDPADDNIVYLHDYDGAVHQGQERKSDGALVRTIDGGKTWETVVQWPKQDSHSWSALVIDRYSEVVEGKGHQRLYLCGYGDILRSDDGGSTWNNIKGDLPNCLVRDLLVIPQADKRTILMANCLTENANKQFEGDIYRSDDNGKTWVKKNSGIAPVFSRYNECNLANSPAAPNTIYYAPGNLCRVYRSVNLGETWEIVCNEVSMWILAEINPTAFGNTVVDYFFLKQEGKNYINDGGYALPLAGGGNCRHNQYASSWMSQRDLSVSPSDPNIIAFTHASIIATTDGGKTWNDICTDLGEPLSQNRWPAGKFPAGKSYFVENDFYFKQVTNSDAKFTPAPSDHTHLMKSRGVQVIVPRNAAFDPFNRSSIAVGYMDIGLRISRDGGAWWEWAYDRSCMIMNDIIVESPVTYDQDVKDRIYIGTGRTEIGDVFRSDDSGRTFQRLHLTPLWARIKKVNEETGKLCGVAVSRIIIDPSSPANKRTLYAGVVYTRRGTEIAAAPVGGIYKTEDGGLTWQEASEGLGLTANIYELKINEKNPNVLYAGVYGERLASGVRGLFKTTNGGKNWRQIAPDKIGGVLNYGIALCRNKPDTIWVVAWPPGVEGFRGRKLFRSDDGGDTWAKLEVKYNQTSLGINSVAVNPVNPDWIYVTKWRDYNESRDSGVVLRSKDGGKTWEIVDDDKIPETAFGDPVASFIQLDQTDPRRLIYYAPYGLWIGFDPEAPQADKSSLWDKLFRRCMN